MKKLNRKGFTLVEIMIVVAIIGLLAAIAIPNFVTARGTAQTNTCLANQRTIQSALELAAFETGADITSLKDDAAIKAIVEPNYIREVPACPTAGAYSTDANGVIQCSNH